MIKAAGTLNLADIFADPSAKHSALVSRGRAAIKTIKPQIEDLLRSAERDFILFYHEESKRRSVNKVLRSQNTGVFSRAR